MGKPRPQKKASKSQEKSILKPGGTISKQQKKEDPSLLLEQATTLLQTGQIEEALQLGNRALEISPAKSSNQLAALNLVAEICVEAGEIDVARAHFLHAVELDPTGTVPESQGGGAEKFLYLAQLSENGGPDSVKWFERGVSALRQIIQQLEGSGRQEDASEVRGKKRELANALCGVAEIYMTDLS